MLTHAHIGNRSRVIDNLCLSEVGMFGFFNRENAGLRKYIPFYGKKSISSIERVFFSLPRKGRGPRGRENEKR